LKGVKGILDDQGGGRKVIKERACRIVCLALAAVLLVPPWGVSSACDGKEPAPTTPPLYERIGGINNIAVLIDDIIERAYVNEVFKANPLIEEAHKRFPKPAYKYNATSLACMVMGGPQQYTGRSLREAHQHLRISQREWQELIAIFRDSMDSFNVPQKEQNEVIAIIESTKGDIIAPPAGAAAHR
jgi:hemoglobin